MRDKSKKERALHQLTSPKETIPAVQLTIRQYDGRLNNVISECFAKFRKMDFLNQVC